MENLENPIVAEDLATAAEPNVATTDENISVDQMFQQSAMPSLGKQIFATMQIHGPTGGLFNIKKDSNDDINLVRADIEVYPSAAIHTGITQEAIQDIRSQFGKEAENIIGKLLRGLANDDENTKTLAFLNTNALAAANLQLTDSLNAETNMFEIIQKVSELVLKSNSKNLRTYQSFAVLPYTPVAGMFGLGKYAGADDKDERGLFLAKIGTTHYFLNPDATDATAFVGLIDPDNPMKSSAVFSPYTSTVVDAIDPNTGEQTYHIYNRYAITANPLHELDNEMLHKFEILL